MLVLYGNVKSLYKIYIESEFKLVEEIIYASTVWKRE